jgi:hypothetical protein
MYHFVHGHGAVCYCDEANYYAEDVVPVWYEHQVRLARKNTVTYATVLFFCLYLACIWSILGTWLCRVPWTVLSHRRGKAGLRVRGNREIERAHEAHVQELKAFSDWVRSGDVRDMAGCEL